jgi:hypothetical protein
MNSRQLTIMGRIGLVIFIIGFAIMLVSLIPNVTVGFYSGSERSSLSYHVDGSYLLSHQVGIRITIVSNGPLLVQILNLSSSEIQDWILEQYPDLDEFQLFSKTHDGEIIEQFLVTHQGRILSNITTTGSQKMDYFPIKMTNVTVLYKNPFGTQGPFSLGVNSVSALISGERVLIPSIVLKVVGGPPALLWVIKGKNKLTFHKKQSPKI